MVQYLSFKWPSALILSCNLYQVACKIVRSIIIILKLYFPFNSIILDNKSSPQLTVDMEHSTYGFIF